MAIDQLTFFANNSQTNGSIPLVGESPPPCQHVRVGLLKDSSLMGTFSLPPPDIPNLVAFINMISSCLIPSNPWIVPNASNVDTFGDRMPLSPFEIEYEAIYSACLTHSRDYGSSSDPFSSTFSTDESIMEIMMSDDVSWDDSHHRSSLPKTFEDNLGDIYSPNIVEISTDSLSIHDINSKKNFRIFKRLFLLIFRLNPKLSKMYILVHLVLPMRSRSIKPFSRNFMMFLPGQMKRCQALIPISLYMKSKHI